MTDEDRTKDIINEIADTFNMMSYDFGARAFIAAYVAGTDLPLQTDRDRLIAISLAKQYIDRLISVEHDTGNNH